MSRNDSTDDQVPSSELAPFSKLGNLKQFKTNFIVTVQALPVFMYFYLFLLFIFTYSSFTIIGS